MKKKLVKGAAVLLGLLAVSEAGGSAYFYRRTMKRNQRKAAGHQHRSSA